MRSEQKVAVHAGCITEVLKDHRNTYMYCFSALRSEWGEHWKHPLEEGSKKEKKGLVFRRAHAAVEDFCLFVGLLRSLAVKIS